MAFGSKSMPARRYAYHCRNVNRKAAELIFDQMRLAHNYQNKLVEIELKRREKVRAAATAASRISSGWRPSTRPSRKSTNP